MYDEPGSHEPPSEGEAQIEAGEVEKLPHLALRFFQVFFSPAELFDRLKARPVWLGALLLLIVINVVGGLILPEDILRQLATAQLPADADPAALESSLSIFRVVSIGGGLVFVPILAAALAGLLAILYNVLLGGEAPYRQLFSIAVHALIVMTVGGLLTILLMRASGEAGAALALHLVAPGLETGSWIYRFLHGINVFGLWTAAILAIGVNRLYPKRAAGAAAILLVSLYVSLKAVFAFFPSFSGG